MTTEFLRALDEPIDRKQVKVLSVRGQKLDYLPGFYVRAQLNKHFKHLWSWQCSVELVAERDTQKAGNVQVVYRASGTLSCTFPGGEIVHRQGIGAAQGQGSWADAHELAIKAAETDALKRAASTLGPQFGLSLYDPSDRYGWDHAVVEDPPQAPSAMPPHPSSPDVKARALKHVGIACQAVATATTIDLAQVRRRVQESIGDARALSVEALDMIASRLDDVAHSPDPVRAFEEALVSFTVEV